ncbi:protein tramtrack, beta isoform-like isoform X2 [Photinus pyralis]|uniref:BTB domain-containing protein n=2 Tax=Photinus pyralis TaxID=7054 RepID=A0A1Y1K1I3_PHOPY|nr:protein tramtrack, beta isoform-like isoform X2 [Photinus pyralis]
MKMASEQFSLCWDNFHRNMSMGMQSLLENEVLVDVTLAIEGRYLKAHKMVLSVCSPYFRELFQSNPCKHPIVFMKDVSYVVLMDLLQFMYQGEVQVAQENLSLFIKTAEALQIKGLTGDNEGQTNAESEEMETAAVDTKKATSRPKKFSGPASKKPKLNPIASSHVKTLPVISSASKFEVTSVNTNSEVTEDVSNFKPEPTEAANEQQSDTETMNDSQIDQYADYANAEDNGDDGDDFSMADTTIDEPKASTSTDIGGGSDNQDNGKSSVKRKPDMPRYIVDGFVFHVNIMKGKPPMMYLRCLEYKRLGCHARAIIPCDGNIQDIKVKKNHNHPPDYTAEEKIVFLRELKEVLMCNPMLSIKDVYQSLSETYPNASREIPFNLIRHKMNRWRRNVGLPGAQ